MGMFFTLLYILIGYLSPPTLFGPLAEYHIEIIVAVAAMIASIPALLESNILRYPQTLAIAGMTFAVFASLAVGGWLGGAPAAVYSFLPNVFIYFLVILHCKTKRHLQLIVLTMLGVAFFVITQGWLAVRAGVETSPYLMRQWTGEGVGFFRLRGLSFIGDPNDLAQVLVSLLPCTLFFWKKGASLRNVALVYVPMAILVYGMYFTHSRGAIVAMLVIIILAGRKKIGTIPALVVAAAMFAATSAVGWSGASGRDISVEGGADRMDAWATGLGLIRSHPFFGVGLFRFTDYYEITAHNTIVVCAAELGFVGLFFWVLFVLCGIRYGVILNPMKKKKAVDPDQGEPEALRGQIVAPAPALAFRTPESLIPAYAAAASSPNLAQYTQPDRPPAALPNQVPYSIAFAEQEADPGPEQEAEFRRLAGLMVITLCGYLAAGWFLSRAYVMTLYIYGGMSQVLYTIAVDRGFAPPPATLPRLLWWSACISVALLFLVYAILRLKNLMPG